VEFSHLLDSSLERLDYIMIGAVIQELEERAIDISYHLTCHISTECFLTSRHDYICL
jgi:hypothetical protein